MAAVHQLHSWDVSPKEAIEIQEKLRSQLIVEPLERSPRYVAGCDISYDKGADTVYAGIVVLELPGFSEVDRATIVTRVKFPYVPGLLSFRESPPLLEAWQKLHREPDVVMIDGQGYAHPRRFGIASHFGLIVDTPTVGCAKTLLIGRYEEPSENAGSSTELIDRDEVIGAVLRTQNGVSPVYVSVGHKVDIESAIEVVMRCTKDYRIPEPTRQAHLLVNALRRGKTLWQPQISRQESLSQHS
jgi:deoxyribonuclease V